MMFVDLLHTWIAPERGGTEQTRKLSGDRGSGQGYLGDVLYERTGFRAYIQRLYGLPDHEIDMEFAARRLFFLQDVCSVRRRAARSVQRLLGRGNVSFDAPDVLVRPEAGFGPVYDAIHAALVTRGVAVHLGSAPEAIRRHGSGTFELLLENGVRRYDRVVSTCPSP